MNHLFETYSERQYFQELLFSTQVDLMSLVVCGMYPSVHAAYQKKAVEVSVSATALYNKLQRIELPVSRALLHETASDLQQLLHLLNVEHPSPLGKEYRLRIVDDKPRLGDSDGANFCEKSKSGGRSPRTSRQSRIIFFKTQLNLAFFPLLRHTPLWEMVRNHQSRRKALQSP